MKLTNYIDNCPAGAQARLARVLGCDPSRISEIKLGKRLPSPRQAIEISLATGCAVTPEELLPTEDWSAYRQALRVKARAAEV